MFVILVIYILNDRLGRYLAAESKHFEQFLKSVFFMFNNSITYPALCSLTFTKELINELLNFIPR